MNEDDEPKSFTVHPRYKPKSEQAFGFFSVLHRDISCGKVQLGVGKDWRLKKFYKTFKNRNFNHSLKYHH